ncbi:DUF1816 domain-containing protein [Leptolyngbya sp. FACHB-261]|uniref:DUF1816 domain-containing protein n=1 Tax=Leptolyngbya sp. FACHB-261 TaxID=2692806 RepID=UPI0016881429|nr:DUF1816 domain-containing protein [Leptolyngbya sp. FACHB-261]MBD2104428.1 DUF1816 domain-containing protein [Leptolyngbya sp. FACHB-261]
MAMLDVVKGVFTNFVTGFKRGRGSAWWAEISTAEPRCTYYFGPFQNEAEAESARPGYIEDLESEGAQGIKVVVKRCDPTVLTVFDEELEPAERSVSKRSFSSQF